MVSICKDLHLFLVVKISAKLLLVRNRIKSFKQFIYALFSQSVKPIKSLQNMIFIFRFKNHMIDLIFMEKIARWLTNTQVKIKAEVANSNSQAQQLAQHLSDLDRRIDACERPNLDKEVTLIWTEIKCWLLFQYLIITCTYKYKNQFQVCTYIYTYN